MPPTKVQRRPSGKPCGNDWSKYNEDATAELPRMFAKIRSLCDALRLPTRPPTRGQKPFPLRSLLKCWLVKETFQLASRRLVGFLRLHRKNLGLRKVPHFNTVTGRARDEDVHAILTSANERLRADLDSSEHEVSIDSTGVATTHGRRWIDEKRGAGNDWRKLHILHDIATGFFLAAEVTDARTHDNIEFPALLGSVRTHARVLADRAYLSRENLQLIEECGATAYIRPKKNTVDEGNDRLARLARRAQNPQWWTIYKRRGSHESRFSAFKRVVKPTIRCRTGEGQTTELLSSVLVHNARIVVRRSL